MPDESILIDKTLISHVLRDAFMLGSKLQGNHFRNTIGYLNQFIATYPTSKIPKDVEALQKTCVALVDYQQGIDDLRKRPLTSKLTELAEKIHEGIVKLKGNEGEYLLMPGGWMSKGGGHAIVYQFRVDNEGNLLFSINNSGSGLQFHEKKSDKEKNLYNPVLTYKIPKNQIKSTELTAFIEALIKPQVYELHKMDKIEPDLLYQHIFPRLSYVHGQVVLSEVVAQDHWYTAGQLSGTCSQRSLHQMLKSRFGSLDDYRQFIYRFKSFALDDYIQSLVKKSTLNAADERDFLEEAIHHNLRLLNVDQSANPGNSLFSLEEQKLEYDKLLGYLSKLRSSVPLVNTTPSISKTPTSIEYAVSLVKPAQPAPGKVDDRAREDVEPPIIVRGGVELLAEMATVLRRCEALAFKKQDQALLEQLESLFLNLPLPNKNIADPLLGFYEAIDSDVQAFHFYQKINQLQTLYFNCCRRLIGESVVLPRMYLVKMSAFAAVSHVNANWRMVANGACYQKYVSGMLYLLSTGSPDQAYIANNSPEHDARYVHICSLYQYEGVLTTGPHVIDKELVSYYQELLKTASENTTPNLVELLQSKYRDKYGADNTHFHQVIRAEDRAALFYFLEHVDELNKDALFNPLINKFNLQLEMEKAYTYSSPFQPYKEGVKINLRSHSTLSILSVAQSPALSNFKKLEIDKALFRSKYAVNKTDAAYAQQRDVDGDILIKRTDNHTQLFPSIYAEINPLSHSSYCRERGFTSDQKASLAQQSINASDLEARELFHLRRHAPFQIRLTLDYFNVHHEKCIKSDLQIYIEANVFQPGLLLAELAPDRSESFLNQFDLFINNGLAFHEKKGELTQPSIFYIRLAFMVNQYASALDSERYIGRLDAFYGHINRYLETTTNEKLNVSLHRYRFLAAVAMMKRAPLRSEMLNDALFSYFQLRARKNPDEVIDTDTMFQLECANHDMMRLLAQHGVQIQPSLIVNILKSLSIMLSESCLSGQYPLFNVRDKDNTLYTVNIERGLVFLDDMAFCITPLDIIKHPLIKQLGLKGLHSCFVSPDGKTFLIEQPTVEIRFIKDNNNYHIQKKWEDNQGQVSWFQLVALTKAQQKALQLADSDFLGKSWNQELQLADIVKERESLAWVHCDKNQLLITDATQQPWYRGEFSPRSVYSTYFQFKDIKHQAVLCNQNTWIHQRLNALENEKFITVAKAEKVNAYIATLSRYGLKFHVAANSSSIQLLDWQGSDYTLQETPSTSFGKGVAQLILSNGAHDICILPIQQFIKTNQLDKTNEYYHLVQDTQSVIPHKVVESILGKDTPQLWQYSGTEQCIVLKMKDGKPVPQSSEEALYLCYVYLGQNQPQKAWAVLEECDKRLGGLAGTYEELRYLSWIINALPYPLESDDKEPVISTPSLVACKLKALALLANFSRQDKIIEFPKPVFDERTVNGMYERHAIDDVQSFYDGVNNTIYALYTRMQAMRREMLSQFTLSDVEQKQLLDFYYDNLPTLEGQPRALGAMGYEWVQQRLTTLRSEFTHLVIKEQMGNLTPYDKQRKQDIDDFIIKHQGVAKVHSHLKYVAIDLKFPMDAKLKETMLSAESQRKIKAWNALSSLVNSEGAQKTAIDGLTSVISDDVLIANFNAYLAIASTPGNPYRAKLLGFCQATIIAHRHTSLNKQANNIPLLCHVLYRVLSSNKGLPNTYSDPIQSYANLLEYAKTLDAPEIRVPQLIDYTDQLLMSAKEIWDLTPTPYKKIIPEIMPDDLTIATFESTMPRDVQTLLLEWRKEEKHFFTGERGESLETPPVKGELSVLNSEEYLVGQVKYDALIRLKTMANQAFTEAILETLTQQTTQSIKSLTESQETLRQAILTLANQGPEDLALKTRWQIDGLSEKRSELNLNQLLTLYFHQDTLRYKAETGLSDEAIQTLHAFLTQFVAQGLQIQQHERVSSMLLSVKKAGSDSARHHAQFLLAQTLFAENLVDVVDDPALSLFQFLEKKLLRPQQKEAIGRLLKTSSDEQFAELVEKIIMGGGKSKIILPALAQKKATGNNLVIIEVPRALLRTNFIDLKATSNTLFNQTAYTFDFNRDSQCSAKRLEQIFNDLTDVMVNKNYLVTTGDALQSLELKYLELLLTPPEVDLDNPTKAQREMKAWEGQIFWADKLVSLFKNRGDLIIDEVHQGLLLKNKLNYTIGDPGRVPQFIVKTSLALYQFLKKINLNEVKGLESSKSYTFNDVLKHDPLFTEDEQFKLACAQLAYELIHHDASPLNGYILSIGGKNSQNAIELFQYLQNKGERVPEFIQKSPSDVQYTLTLYKEQIRHFLPHTLKRNQGEHYGPSKSMHHSPEVRALAIPYLANNVPNERSRFGNCIETVNYSIQSLVLSGVTKDLLRNFLEDLQIQARKELYDRSLKSIDDTSSAELFKQLSDGMPLLLSQVDLDDDAQLLKLHQQLQHQEALIYEVLKSSVLKQIRTDPAVLHHDAYNHVEMVRSCQAMSGTPWNQTTYHQRLHYDIEATKGTDGLIYSAIKAKLMAVRGLDFNGTEAFMEGLFKTYKVSDQARAIIDICATFKGIDSLVVAKTIASYIHKNPSQFNTPASIEYVLYFNQEHELSALRIGVDLDSQIPIVIGTSSRDAIIERLGCGPEACFSYYDQSHTVGADLAQTEQARGLVLVDEGTALDSFLQGAMRMRGLVEGEQCIDLIVPTRLERKSLEQLAVKMGDNQLLQLKQDNFEAARLGMTNLIRTELLGRVLAVNGEDLAHKKRKLTVLFENYFVERQLESFYDQFGGLNQEQDTRELLQKWQDQLMADWTRVIKMADQTISNESMVTMSLNMGKLVEHALSLCAPKQTSRSASLDSEVEVQKEVLVEIFIEEKVLKDMYDPLRREEDYIPWEMNSNAVIRNQSKLSFKTLTSICKTTGAKEVPEFGENIFASKNFYQSYQNQENYVGQFLKPVHAILFRKINSKLNCSLITMQESQELEPWVAKQRNGECWMSTTQHTVLAGKSPIDLSENPEYQAIIEQVRYFNGEFSLLLQKNMTREWLDENARVKLDFFEQHLSSGREALRSQLKQMSGMYSINKKVYQFISQTPIINRVNFDWKSAFPECEESDIEGYQAVAKAFNEVTVNWASDSLALMKWDIPLLATGYIKQYINKLSELKKFLTVVEDFSQKLQTTDKPLSVIALMSSDQKRAMGRFFPKLDLLLQSDKLCERGYYDLLVQLVTEIPSLESHRAILHALSSNPFINDEQLQTLLSLAPSDKLMLHGLLTNKSKQITQEHFNQLFSLEQDERTLSVLAQHPYLKEEQLIDLTKQAKADDAVFLACLSRDDYVAFNEVGSVISEKSKDKLVLETLLNKARGGDYSLLEKIAAKALDSAMLKVVVEKIEGNNEQKDSVLRAAAQNIKANDEVLALIAHKTTDTSLIQELFQKAAGESTYKSIAGNLHTNTASLIQVMKKSSTSGTLLACLSHSQTSVGVIWAFLYRRDLALFVGVGLAIARSALESNVLSALVAKTKEHQIADSSEIILRAVSDNINADDIILSQVISISKNDALINNLMSKARAGENTYAAAVEHSQLTNKSLIQIAAKTHVRATLRACFNHVNANDDVFLAFLSRSHEVSFLELGHIIADKFEGKVVLTMLLTKTQVDNYSLLEKIASIALDSTMLADVVQKAPQENLLRIAAGNLYADDNVFNLVVKKTSDSQLIQEVVDKKLAGENAYSAIACNPATNEKTLEQVAMKSTNSKTLLACLSHVNADDQVFLAFLSRSDAASFIELGLIIAEKSTNREVLTTLATKTQANNVLLFEKIATISLDSTMLTYIIKKTSSSFTSQENVLRIAADNPHADDNVFSLVVEKTVDSNLIRYVVDKELTGEKTYKAIASNSATDEKTLEKVARKSTNSETLLACLNHEKVTDDTIESINHALINNAMSNASAEERTYAAAVEHSRLTNKSLTQVAAKTQALTTLRACFNHVNANDDVFLAFLARSDAIFILELGHIIVAKSKNRDVLTNLLKKTQANNYSLLEKIATIALDSLMLAYIVQKTSSSSASKENIFRIAADSPHANDFVLSLLVEKIADSKLIQDVVDKKLAGEKTYNAIACNPATNEKTLEQVAKKSTSPEVLLVCLSHRKVTDDAIKTINTALINNEMSNAPDVEKTYASAVVNSRLTNKSLIQIAAKTHVQATLRACFNHVNANDDVFLAFLSRSDAIFILELGHIIADKFEGKVVLTMLLTKTQVDNYSLLEKIASIALDSTMLADLVQKAPQEKLLRIAAGNPHADDDFFSLVVKKTSDSQLIQEVVDKKLAGENAYSAIACNPATNEKTLEQVAMKSTNSKTLLACLGHKKVTDDTIESIIDNSHVTVSLLLECYDKTEGRPDLRNKITFSLIQRDLNSEKQLFSSAEQARISAIGHDCIDPMLRELEKFKFSEDDVGFNEYVEEFKARIDTLNTFEAIAKLCDELKQVIEIQESPGVEAIRIRINELRSLDTLAYPKRLLTLTRGAQEKADAIKSAMVNLPLRSRGAIFDEEHVLDQQEIKAVKEALASHRRLGIKGNVYKTNEEISERDAAKSFKKLKAQYSTFSLSDKKEPSPNSNKKS